MKVSMNKLTDERRVDVVKCVVGGNADFSTVRITGVAKNTVTKLLVDLGTACSAHRDGVMKNLQCKRIQVDEIWSFIKCKARTSRMGAGTVRTRLRLDVDSDVR